MRTVSRNKQENKKTPNSLKPRPKIVKNSVNQKSAQTKDATITSQVQAANEDQKKTAGGKRESHNGGPTNNLSHGTKEKKITSEVQVKIVKKSVNPKPAQTKEGKNTSQVQAANEHEKKNAGGKRKIPQSEKGGGRNTNLSHVNKEKIFTKDEHEERCKLEHKTDKDIGGVILMCNSKTKPDCFQYSVMGVPTDKEELVMSIKPGLTLFLYDFELRVLYGIYKASSAGGMKLEPAAFDGAFPVQVRFEVYRDCLPLPEGVFKKAFKERRKFKNKLTVQEVKTLTDLFQSAPSLHSNALPCFQELQPAPQLVATAVDKKAHSEQFYRNDYSDGEAIGSLQLCDYERNQLPRHYISPRDTASPDPLFISEREYRSYGLRRDRHTMTTTTAPISSTSDAYRSGREKEQLQRDPDSASGYGRQNESSHLDPLFLSEKEYRAYGLRRELPSAAIYPIESDPTALDTYPKASHFRYEYGSSSLVDQYLPLPRAVTAPSDIYSLTRKEAYTKDFTYMESDARNRRGVVSDEAEGLYSSYASHALSDYNRKYQHYEGQPEATSAPVSSRYSFAGPSPSYR